MKDNLSLWKQVECTDPLYTKEDRSRGGKTMTSIVPQYQIKNATKVLGIFGTENFRVYDETFTNVVIDDKNILCLYQAKLKAKYEDEEIEICLHSSAKVCYVSKDGRTIIETEYAKKVATDALTKGLSKLGFNADVFLGYFDDKSYVKKMDKKFAAEEE